MTRKILARKRIMSTLLSFVMAFSLVFSPLGSFNNQAAVAAEWSPATEKPVLVVTGTGIVGGSPSANDLTEGIANERAYTRAEIDALEDGYFVYSWQNTSSSKRIYKAKGVPLTKLFEDTEFTSSKYDSYTVKAMEIGGSSPYTTTFDPAYTGGTGARNTKGFGVPRYFFSNYVTAAVTPLFETLNKTVNEATDEMINETIDEAIDETSDEAIDETIDETNGESEESVVDTFIESGESGDITAMLDSGGVLTVHKTAMSSERGTIDIFAADAEKTEVPVIVATKAVNHGNNNTTMPTDTEVDAGRLDNLLLLAGQLDENDQNSPLANSNTQKILVGEELPSILKVSGKEYTRAELLMLPRYEGTHSYINSATVNVESYIRGIPLVNFLTGYKDSDQVKFITADNHSTADNTVTIADIKSAASKYVLAYEKGADASNLAGIYDTSKGDSPQHGYLTVYAEGKVPIKMVNEITVTVVEGTDFQNSPFKHINNGGLSGSGPYNIAAITGATLTVEGPGLVNSVPVSIRQLEEENGGAFRGDYTDNRASGSTTLTYEGIKLSHILERMQATGIKLTDKAAKVQIKNRVRHTIAEFSLAQIAEADSKGKPIIVAYGTSNGSETAPFVYDGTSGKLDGLGNDDGCIKLVYDKSAVTGDLNSSYTKFGNMAYIYLEEDESPGYKHDKFPYNTPENSQYVVTITGDKIGREVNYTVEQLEKLVEYDENGKPKASGMGYRDEYSLANSNYWYVNEYEGVKLWDLLNKAGVEQSDLSTRVQFRATDGYTDFDNFTLEQISNPDLFGYYEKNPADENDGKYVSTDEADLRETGYPVLVSYGVNRYPYVIKNTLEGFKSGLGNDGGPVRIISGKTDYHHANGSKQAKLLDKIIVGTEVNYSTHEYNNTNAAYAGLADKAIAVQVLGMDGSTIKDTSYTIGQIEDLIYGSVTNAQKQAARVKDFYGLQKGAATYTDLYEGVSFKYFLENVVQIPGNKGTVEFTCGEAPNSTVMSLTLDDLYALGSNSQSQKDGLAAVLAFAKNGYPMVTDKNAAGYVGSYVDGYEAAVDVKNDGGPLALLTPEVDGSITAALNVTAIKISLQPDKYAHMGTAYDELGKSTITIGGEGTRLTEAKEFSVAELEGKQTIAFTGDYNIMSAAAEEQIRYRGIDLYALLQSTDIGLKVNASELVITDAEGKSITVPLADIIKRNYVNGQQSGVNDLRMILAYGSAAVDNPDPEDGKPLVKTSADEGYDSAYKNSGGPLRLVVGQTDADEQNAARILDNVASITVNASELTACNHSISPVYQQYLDEEYTLRVVDGAGKTLLENTYTLGQIEAMTDLLVKDSYTYVGTHDEEGIDLWRFIKQEAAGISGITDPSQVKVAAGDGYSRDLLVVADLDALENGIKDGTLRKIIILSYATDNKPLVPGTGSDGYVSGNDGGPLRLMIQNNQGACLKDTRTIEVTVSGGSVTPSTADFALRGNAFSGNKEFTVAQLTSNTAKTTKDYSWYDRNAGTVVTDTVSGVPLAALLGQNGVSGSNYTVSLITVDNYTDSGRYLDLPLSDINAKDYMVVYEVNGAAISDSVSGQSDKFTNIRIYRDLEAGTTNEPGDWRNRVTNVVAVEVTKTGAEPEPDDFDFYPADGKTLPFSGLRAAVPDTVGGVWVGTYGAGAAYMAANGEFTFYNTGSTPALKSDIISDLALDGQGGVWFTQCGNYDGSTPNSGVAYLKDGRLTFYDTGNSGLPHNFVQQVKVDRDGNVWFGSSAGITKYTPESGAFRTWTVADGLPARSVDNFTLDGKGGVWIGTYPEDSGSGTDYHFSGGYAYLDAGGQITAYRPEASEDVSPSSLADFWVRRIAVDASGGVYVVRSGSYATLANVGGRVDYIAPDGAITHYKGKDIIPDLQTKATESFNPEIRTMGIDPDGNLWFGTSGLGVYTGPSIDALTTNYSSAGNYWPAASANDNIYALSFSAAGDVCVGSAGGLAVKKAGDTPGPEPEDPILEVSGAGVDSAKSFTLSELKNAVEGVHSLTYTTLNNFGTRGTRDVTGIELPYLLDNMVKLKSQAVSITVIAKDGYPRTFALDDGGSGVYSKDKDGNPMLLAWLENGKDMDLKLIVGQTSEDHANLPLWVNNVAKIVVNVGGEEGPAPNLASLTLTGGSLTPSFNENTTKYILPVETSVGSIEITAKANPANAQIKINGSVLAADSTTIDLADDNTTLRIEVSHEARSKTYVVEIYKKAAVVTSADNPLDGSRSDSQLILDSTVGGVQVNTSSDGSKEAALPLISFALLGDDGKEKSNIYIPEGTVVTPAESGAWDGNITMPAIMPNNSVTISNAVVNAVVKFGSDDTVLYFDKPVRLKFDGWAGKKVGYVEPGQTTVTEISNLLAADSGDALLAPNEDGYLNVGNDLIVWTTHMTRFVIYESSGTGGPGSSGGGSGIRAKTNPPIPDIDEAILDISDQVTVTTENGRKIYSVNEKVADVFNSSNIINIVKINVGTDQAFAVELPWTVLKSLQGYEHAVALQVAGERSNVYLPLNQLAQRLTDESTLKFEYEVSAGDNSAALLKFWQRTVSDVYSIKASSITQSGEKTEIIKTLQDYMRLEIPLAAAGAYSQMTGMKENETGTGLSPLPTSFAASGQDSYATVYTYVPGNIVVVRGERTFTDIGGHWAWDSITAMACKALVNGKSDDEFYPDDDITRAEFAAIINRSMGYPPSTFSALPGVSADDWYAQDMAVAAARGLMVVDSSGMRPQDRITRAEIATILQRAAKANNALAEDAAADVLTGFTDNSLIPDWANSSLAWAVQNDIMRGDDNNSLNAENNATRAESLVMITRLMEKQSMFSK